MSALRDGVFGSGVTSILHNAGYLLGGRWLNIIVRFGYAVILTRLLGPERYGYFAYGISWYLALQPVAGLGLDVILGRRIGQAREAESRLVSQTLTLKLLVCTGVSLTCAVTGWFMEARMEMRLLLLIFSVALFGRSIAMWAEFVFAAYERTKFALHINAVFRPLEVAGGVIGLLAGRGILWLALIQAASWWGQAVAGLFYIRKIGVRLRPTRRFEGVGSLLRQGLPIAAATVLAQWMLQGPLILFRNISEDSGGLGQFALTFQLFIVFSHIPVSLNVAALPALSRSALRQDGKEVHFVSMLVRASFLLGVCIGIPCFALGQWLVPAFFGVDFLPAAKLLPFAVLMIIPWTGGVVASRVYFARQSPLVPFFGGLAGVTTLLVGMPFLAGRFGVLGAVGATGAGMGVWCAALIFMLSLDGIVSFWGVIVNPMLVSGGALAVYFVLERISPMLATLLSVALFLILAWSAGLVFQEEKVVLANACRSFFRGSGRAKRKF